MTRALRLFLICISVTVGFSSCEKYEDMPYFGYEYMRDDGAKRNFCVDELRVIKTTLGGEIIVPMVVPEMYISEEGKNAFFYFCPSEYCDVNIKICSDTTVFYEGVKYHYSLHDERQDTVVYNDGVPYVYKHPLSFIIDYRTQCPIYGWITFNYGSGNMALCLQFEIEYRYAVPYEPSPGYKGFYYDYNMVTGSVFLYNRIMNKVQWREWIRPAEENEGPSERWIVDSYPGENDAENE